MSAGTRARDPHTADEDKWLEALAREWSRLYLISVNIGRWFAIRRDGSGDALIAATPGKLATAMVENRRPVSGRMTVGGLSPHDALALDGLAEQWGELYRLRYADGTYLAFRWDDTPPLAAETLEGLASTMRADFYRRMTQ